MQTDSAADRSKLGAAFVLAVGPAPWWGAAPGDTTDRFIVSAVAWLGLPFIAHALLNADSIAWGLVLIGATSVFVVPIAVWGATRRWLFGTNVFVVLPVRLSGALAIAVGLDHSDRWPIVGLLLLGLIAGCDATLSLRAVGIEVELPSSIGQFLVSSVNVGVLLGLLTVVAVAGWDAVPVAGVRYGALLLVVALMLGVAASLQAADRMMLRHRCAAEQVVRDRERRERAHWIHDDVCAELRTVRLRLDAAVLEPTHVAQELSDLDHRLRLRQLDEQMASGDVRLAEIVQPFVRMLQDRGIELSDVPGFDSANAVLGERTGALLRRSVSVLTSNALNAGATRIGVRCAVRDDAVRVEIDDDAGGFRLEDVPAGRGLDGLRRDVAELTVGVDAGGTTVAVEIPRHHNESGAAETPVKRRARR